MHLLLIVSVLLGVAVVCLDARQRPSFRSTIDLVMLNVTVTGPGGKYVSDLSADDFQVLEDGRPQDVAYFSPANVPLSVSLVLDTSSSMDEEMPLSKQAAMDFIARLRPGDVAEVVSFDSKVEVLAADDERSCAAGSRDSAHARRRIDRPLQRGLYRLETARRS